MGRRRKKRKQAASAAPVPKLAPCIPEYISSLKSKLKAEAHEVIETIIPTKIETLSVKVERMGGVHKQATGDFASSTGSLFDATLGPPAGFAIRSPPMTPRGGHAHPLSPTVETSASAAGNTLLSPLTTPLATPRAGKASSGAGDISSDSASDELGLGSMSFESSSSSDSSSSSATPSSEIPAHICIRSNSVIRPMIDRVKGELHEFIDAMSKLKNYIQMEVPSKPDRVKHWDVTVQITILGEIVGFETVALTLVRRFYSYYNSRAKLVAKVLKHPWNADLQNSILQLDDRWFTNLSVTYSFILNSYLSLQNSIEQNSLKIFGTKTVDPSLGSA